MPSSFWQRLWAWLRPPVLLSIYCDGSAHDRSGWPGGWAFAVVRAGQCLHSDSGGSPRTTNNQMELQAALAGLQHVHAQGWHVGAPVELVSDSRMTLDVASGSDLPVHHRDLALAVRAASVAVGAQVRWVRGHSGDMWNERVDRLAHEAKERLVPRRVRERKRRR